MEFKVYKEVFLKELNLLQGAVETKTTIAILGNVRLEALVSGSVKLAATNLELAVRSECKAAVASAGKSTVPAKKLLDLISLFPEGEIGFKLLDNLWMEITAGKKRYKLVGMSAENFPEDKELPRNMTKIKAAIWKTLINKVAFAITTEESRYVINGALFVFTPEQISAVATDGHRLALAKMAGEFKGAANGKRVIVPRRVLAELVDFIKDAADEAEVGFAADEGNLYFSSGEREIVARQITGQFPAYEAVMPKGNDKVALLNRAELLSSVQRVAQLSDERTNAVRFSLSPGALEIASASPEYGEANEILDATYDGPAMTIGFNAKYFAEFLTATNAETIAMAVKDGNSAGDLRPVGDEQHEYVIMPMRI